MPRVCVVGSANLDYTVALPRLPSPGETVSGGTLLVNLGGKGANQAMAARRLGGEVRMIGCVGADTDGRRIRAALSEAGIGIEGLIETGRAATGTAGAYNYTTTTGSGFVAATATQNFEVSINGGPVVTIGAVISGATETTAIDALNVALSANATARASGFNDSGFIARAEVSGPEQYRSRYRNPAWPSPESGAISRLTGTKINPSVTTNPGGFNFKAFQSNVVFRWEYKPGSTLFAVWNQGRQGFIPREGDQSFRGDVGDLFNLHPANTFLIKMSYWLNR